MLRLQVDPVCKKCLYLWSFGVPPGKVCVKMYDGAPGKGHKKHSWNILGHILIWWAKMLEVLTMAREASSNVPLSFSFLG